MVGIVICCALVGGAAPVDFTQSEIDVMARRYRIQTYYKFRADRHLLDRRLAVGDILLDATSELDADDRQQVANWFQKALIQGEAVGNPTPKLGQTFPKPPFAHEKIQLAWDKIDRRYSSSADSPDFAATEFAASDTTPNGNSTGLDVAPDDNTSTSEPQSSDDIYGDSSASSVAASRSAGPENATDSQPEWTVEADSVTSTSETNSTTAGVEAPGRKGGVFRTLGRITVRRLTGVDSNRRFQDVTNQLESQPTVTAEVADETQVDEWSTPEIDATPDDSAPNNSLPGETIIESIDHVAPQPEIRENPHAQGFDAATLQSQESQKNERLKQQILRLSREIQSADGINHAETSNILKELCDLENEPVAEVAAGRLFSAVRNVVAGPKFNGTEAERRGLLQQINEVLGGE